MNLLKRLTRGYSPKLRSRGMIIKRFADKIGLVYFGTVDQNEDDHDIIRGLTVSTTHQDSHFAVGSYDGYDISLVDRFDIVVDHNRKTTEHNWLIMRFDLERQEALPHIFLKPINSSADSYNKFFSAFHHLQPVNGIFQAQHSSEFHNRYEVYTTSSRALEIEALFTPTVTNTIAARFWPHAIEILDNKLYVYTTESQLSETLLETVLQTSLWLSQVIDETTE